ncbi:MAG: radical SAM protein [Candidatus Omnitrophica bacterium]|nr:radical SAM protein [Candidatus Omnitrophota bacterium]
MASAYLALLESGELENRVERARTLLAGCVLCPRECGVNRLKGERGFCKSDEKVKVSNAGAHFGEEPPLTGKNGSGTIFFTNCNMRCVFCQNYQISQEGLGSECSADELAGMMLNLQFSGCHNINLVSPTHFVPQILEALLIAARKGLKIPLVYNTNGYDSSVTLGLLDGIIDIYLPDIKYADDNLAKEFSSAVSYAKSNRDAIVKMYRQVGGILLDKDGIAMRGLIVRHLILPGQLQNTYGCLSFLVCFVSRKIVLSLMSQYEPRFNACGKTALSRRLTAEEYEEAVKWVSEFGFENCLIQGLDAHSCFLPDFSKPEPFKASTLNV